MKPLLALAPCSFCVPMLGACVLTTDFDRGTEDSSSTDDTSSSDTDVEPTSATEGSATDDSATDGSASEGSATDGSDTGPVCGDGMLDPEEECDDANQTNGDGCQTDCTVTGGETIWTVEAPDLSPGTSVIALPDGGFVVGTGLGPSGSVIRFDADGQQVWAQAMERHIGGLAPSPDGDVLVVGTNPIEIKFAIGELWVGELSVENGSEQWAALPGIPLESTHGEEIAVGPAGELWVGGFSGGEGGANVLMAGLGAEGMLQWWDEALDLGGGYAATTDVVALPDGSAVFVGGSELDVGNDTPWARRVDATGQELWTVGLDGGSISATIERRDDGSLVVAAGSTIIMLDEDGSEQWRRMWQRDEVNPPYIMGTSLAPAGTLYVTGSYWDAVNVGFYGALDAEGEHLWLQLFGPVELHGGHAGYDAAILADGNVVFVGEVSDARGNAHLWMRKTEP